MKGYGHVMIGGAPVIDGFAKRIGADGFTAHVEADYRRRTGIEPRVYAVSAAAGAGLVAYGRLGGLVPPSRYHALSIDIYPIGGTRLICRESLEISTLTHHASTVVPLVQIPISTFVAADCYALALPGHCIRMMRSPIELIRGRLADF